MFQDVSNLRSFGERLVWARDFRNLKMNTRFARSVGVSTKKVERWEKGETRIKDQDLVKVAAVLRMREAWLLTGEGPIFVPAAVERFLSSDRAQGLEKALLEDLPRIPFQLFGYVDPDDDEVLSVVESLRLHRDAAETRHRRKSRIP